MAELIHPHGQFDNHAADYAHIAVKPLAAAMGAEIAGVQCAMVTDAQFAEIEHALFRHKMIYFRNQSMRHADQSAFSSRFGAFAEDAYTQGVTGFPEVQPLIKEADERTGHVFGSGWHTDSPFLAEPPAISILRSVQIPPFGGDTIWANSALARHRTARRASWQPRETAVPSPMSFSERLQATAIRSSAPIRVRAKKRSIAMGPMPSALMD